MERPNPVDSIYPNLNKFRYAAEVIHEINSTGSSVEWGSTLGEFAELGRKNKRD